MKPHEPRIAGGAGESGALPGELSLLIEVAHDIRSPLTSILFLAETLRDCRGQTIGPTQERQLMLIYSAAFDLCALATDLTELGRGREQMLERSPAPFSLDDVFESVRQVVRPIAEERAIDIRLAQEARPERLGHPAALGRVLLNLLTNALRSTESGFVEVAARPLSGTRVEFSVRDTGPGLPDDLIENLASPFDPGAIGQRCRFSSSGLGLTICRRLLIGMESDLSVRRMSERGACVYFALELPPADDEKGGEAARPT
ncbi:MAG TPA: HAMP domain-containing sensor histidine kinase [Gemmatimonadaceae bacterium]|nr:HAMP domain-containing sensor histidine kinase [Gemmatimonadaceae bacterium]